MRHGEAHFCSLIALLLCLLTAGPALSAWYLPSDIVPDGNINMVDLAPLASNWLNRDSGLCDNADITFDDAVDANDLQLFLQRWLDLNYKDRLCKNDVLVVSQPEMTEDVIVGSSNRIICSENALFIFATDAIGNVYRRRKSAGSEWELTATKVADTVWCLWDSYLFGVKLNKTFRYSEDNGETWHDCNTPPNPTYSAIFYSGWSLAVRKPGEGDGSVNSYGTIILVEYGQYTLPGKKIFKSMDHGINWTQQYQLVYGVDIPSLQYFSHFHTVGYHRGTNRFLAIVGDTANRRMLYSDDDGDTWITAQIYSGVQPVQLLDTGHPTEFVCGADRALAVYTLDVSNMEIATKHQKLTNWQDATGVQTYCFMLKYLDGLYYAFQCDTTSPDRLNKISVSPDLEHWAVYYQFKNNEKGVRYAGGLSEDGVHLTVVNALDKIQSMVLKTANVKVKPSFKIIPPVNNVFSSSDMSLGNGPNSPNYWANTDTNSAIITSDPNGGLFDERHIKLSKGYAGYISAINPFNITYVPRDGRTYVGRVWLRGYSANQVARVQIGTLAKGYSIGEFRQLINADDWLEIITDPLTIPATGGLEPVGFKIYTGTLSSTLNGNGEIHIGGVCISPNRAGLQLDSNCESPAILRKPVNVPESWSSCFRIIPDSRHTSMIQYGAWDSNTSYAAGVWATYSDKTYESLQANNIGNNPQSASEYWRCVPNFRWHVKTWMQDLQNYLCLYLDSNDLKFKLDAVVDGNAVETLQTALPFKFEWMSQLDFAVCLDGTEGQESLKLVVSNASHLEHIVGNSIGLRSAVANGYMRNRQISQVIGNPYWLSTKTAAGNSRGDMVTVPMFAVTENDHEFEQFLSNDEIDNAIDGL